MKKERTETGWLKSIINPATISTVLMLVILGTMILVWQRLNNQEAAATYFKGEINRFCIKNICLDKSNNSWWLSTDNKREPADNEVITNLVNKFQQITLNNLVSTNKDKFGEYGIGTDPISLEINGNSLEIGKLNATGDGIYVRPGKDNKVYDISQIIERDKMTIADYWRNKLVTNWPSAQLTKISLANGKNIKTYESKNNKWDDPQLPEIVAHLKESDYLNDWKKDGSNEVITIDANTSQEKFNLTLGIKNNIYWATPDGTHFFAIGKDDYLLIQKDLR